jgi:hypothetical protein
MTEVFEPSNRVGEGESAFDRFLSVARGKDFPQVLLLVFAEKEQRIAGGEMTISDADFSVKPAMYIDKKLDDVSSFIALQQDSLENGKPWDLLFVTALNATKFHQQTIDQRLEMMVKLIYQGESDRFLVFNQFGELVNLNKISVH